MGGGDAPASQSQLMHSQRYELHERDDEMDEYDGQDGGEEDAQQSYAYASSSASAAHLSHLPPPSLEAALSLNALQTSLSALPHPYRAIQDILNGIVEAAWDKAQQREQDGLGGDARRGRVIVIEGEEEEDEPPPARVQVASQQPITRSTDIPTATPSRVVTPLFPPSGMEPSALLLPSSASSSSCASVSLDGRLALLGSRGGALFVADLSRSYSFVFALQGSAAAAAGVGSDAAAATAASASASPRPVSAVAVSPLPILRGDEDPLGDEMDTQANYLLAWSCTPVTLQQAHTIRVATLNAHTWQVTEGCTITLPLSFPAAAVSPKLAAATAALLGGTPGTAVVGLQFAQDGSHLAVSTADGSQSVFQLRAHRYDPLLEAPRVSQKEQLLKGIVPSLEQQQQAHSQTHVELQAILSDHALGVNADGLSYVEHRRTITVVQQKLYTATLVLHARPPRALIESLRAAQMRKEGPVGTQQRLSSTQTIATAAAGAQPEHGGGSPSSSPAAKSNRRASLKMDATAAAAALAAVSATAAASYASFAAADAPPARCIAPATLYFLRSMQSRQLGQAPHYLTTGVAILWQSDTQWSRWELSPPRPVLPGESLAAIAKLATQQQQQQRSGGGANAMSSQGSPVAATKSIAASTATTGSKLSKADKTAPDPAAIAAAAAVQAETVLYTRPTPAPLSTVTGSRVSASALDASSSFLAVGLRSGTVVVYDTRLGAAVRCVLHGTPSLSHSGALDEPLDPESPPQQSQVNSLAFLESNVGCTHLVAGLADCTLRTFALPPRMARDPPQRLTDDAQLTVRISTKLPGAVQSVRIGSKIPIAVVGVSNNATASQGTSTGAAASSAPQELFVYDILSNHVIGKLLPPTAAPSGSGSTSLYNFSPSPLSQPNDSDEHADEQGNGGRDSLASTAAFTVFEQKEDGSVARSGGYPRELRSTFGRSVAGVPQLRPSHAQSLSQSQGQHGGGADSFRGGAADSPRSHRPHALSGDSSFDGGQSSPPAPIHFHPLVSSTGVFATLGADQIVLLGASTSPSTSPSSTSLSATMLVFPLAELVCSLYPSIVASCPNAFLRQQHAVGLFLAHATHAARRAPGAFAAYLAAQDRIVARSSQAALSAAFASGAGRSVSGHHSRMGSTKTSPRSLGAAHHHSRKGSAGASHVRLGSGSYQPALSSIYGGSVAGSTSGSGSVSSMGRPRHHHSVSGQHGRQGSTSSFASHKRTASSSSRSPERHHARALSAAAAAAARAVASLPPSLPRDGAFVVASVLSAAANGAAQRSTAALKARRTEMHLQLQAQQKMQQQAARFGNGAGGTMFPRLVHASQ